MKLLGYEQRPLGALFVDMDDIRNRMSEQHVKDLAEDIKVHGGEPIHAPLVSTEGTLICGRDRYAASMVLGLEAISVHVVECDEVEAQELELTENIYRRTENRSKLLARLVSLREQQIRALDETTRSGEVGTVSHPRSSRSQDTPRARARKDVARTANVSVGAVKKAERRADPPKRKSDAEKALELPPSFETFGVELPESRRASILGDLEDMSGWHQAVADIEEAMRLWQQRQAGALNIPKIKTDGIRSAASALILAIANAKPVAVCAWCKGVRCQRCGNTGLAGRFGNEGAGVELLKPVRRKAVQVEMPDGSMFTPEEEKAS